MDYEQIESEQRQHHEVMRSNDLAIYDREEHIYRTITALNGRIYQDGNQWCALVGEDLQAGIAGFGDTPKDAALEFGKNFGI